MKVYILVSVSYDYYRFQENLMASVDKTLLIEKAKLSYPDLRVFEYPDIENTPLFLSSQEEDHLWIQTLPELVCNL